MPQCYACKRPVSGDKLKLFGKNNRGWPEDELGCSGCRRKRLTQVVSKEVTMSVKEHKPIASIQVFPTDDDNFAIEGYVRVGGVKIEIDTDVNRVRDFFTKRRDGRIDRAAKKPRHLQNVKE